MKWYVFKLKKDIIIDIIYKSIVFCTEKYMINFGYRNEKTNKNKKIMSQKGNEKRNSSNFLVGLIAIIPVVLIFKIFASVPEWIVNPFRCYLPEFFAELLGLFFLVVAIWCIGVFINQGKIGIALKRWMISIVKKIPVVGYLFDMASQVIKTINATSSFKEVVVVEYPRSDCWALAFVVREHDGLLELHLPSVPSIQSAPQMLTMEEQKVYHTNLTVKEFANCVFTAGAHSDMEKAMAEIKKAILVKKANEENEKTQGLN